jgi:hypothetical protein
MSKTVFPTWLRDNPPKDRQFRALAYNADCRDSSGFVRVVAEWDGNADEWRPVEVPGEPLTGTKLEILGWTELPL